MKKPELDRNFTPENSSMASNMEEIENLGKQMENRRTNQELTDEYGKKPDPIQDKKEEK